jgi:hypothetical protein
MHLNAHFRACRPVWRPELSPGSVTPTEGNQEDLMGHSPRIAHLNSKEFSHGLV